MRKNEKFGNRMNFRAKLQIVDLARDNRQIVLSDRNTIVVYVS